MTRFPLWSVPVVAALAALGGCQGGGGHAYPFATAGTGGQAGADGGSAAEPDGAAGMGDAGDEVAPQPASECVESPTPKRATGVVLSLPVVAVLDGKPVAFGEPNELPGGGTVMPLNFRFYVSRVALTAAGDTAVPVDLVDAAGAVEPYGVHLFIDEDTASHTLRVLAPPGSYTGVQLTLGLDDACNSGTPATYHFPLGQTSQMVWPMGLGYLFLRFEGQTSAADAGADGPPNVIHMGGFPRVVFAPAVRIAGALSLTGATASRTVNLDLGAVFQGATTAPAPSAAPSVPIAPPGDPGERLRQNAPGLPLFVFPP